MYCLEFVRVHVKVLSSETSEAHSEHCRTSTMELFAKIVNRFKPLTIFTGIDRVLNTPVQLRDDGLQKHLYSTTKKQAKTPVIFYFVNTVFF